MEKYDVIAFISHNFILLKKMKSGGVRDSQNGQM